MKEKLTEALEAICAMERDHKHKEKEYREMIKRLTGQLSLRADSNIQNSKSDRLCAYHVKLIASIAQTGYLSSKEIRDKILANCEILFQMMELPTIEDCEIENFSSNISKFEDLNHVD